MSAPTFDSTALTTAAEKTVWTAPENRMAISHVPGVAGGFVQNFGQGTRTLRGRGLLEAAGATTALAAAALKAAIKARHDLIAASAATYVDSDALSYTNCWLTSYEQVSDINMPPSAISGSYYAWCQVAWTILQPVPAVGT